MLDVLWHEGALMHATGTGLYDLESSGLLAVDDTHPENPVRVTNIKAILERGPLRDHVTWKPGRYATVTELERVHEASYVEQIRRLADAGGGRVTPSTLVSAGSWRAALAAAGTAVAAVDGVLDGSGTPAYAISRPPGHHAQPDRADGYCLFNNVAIAAAAARERGVERVAILDWDVHHGNGTQACFYARRDVLTISLHMPHGSWGASHPQTGSPTEVGTGTGEGFNVNVELCVGTGNAGYAATMRGLVGPIVDAFAPELLLIAAGQDASQLDANGRQCLDMAGFRALGSAARELADRHCEGRLVLVQEGGYALSYAPYCLHATLEGVLGLEPTLPDVLRLMPDEVERGAAGIAAARAALSSYWPV